MNVDSCVFCQIVRGDAEADVVDRWHNGMAIRPLAPLTEGHVLLIPDKHVLDFASSPVLTGQLMVRAARLAAEARMRDAHVLTNMGTAAGQEVFHFHVHLIPRKEGDGLRVLQGQRRRALATRDRTEGAQG